MADDLGRILDTKGKSEDDFEKNITYISAGTLVLSLTFVEKIVSLKDASYIGALKWSWICLAATLLVNLASHVVASWFGDKTYIEERDAVENRDQKVAFRNLIMRGINWLTIGTLICGMSLLIYFATKNAYAMADKEHTIEKPLHENPNYFEKGRTYAPGTSTGTGSNTTQSSPSQTPNTGNTTQTPKKD